MNIITRQQFIKRSAMSLGGLMAAGYLPNTKSQLTMSKSFSIDQIKVNFEREPLAHPFGFKGGYISQLRQVAAQITSNKGKDVVGLGVQSPLWSDAAVTGRWGETGSNALMYCLTEKAKLLVKETKYSSPIAMTEEILDEVHAYAKRITENKNLKQTFPLNALVPIDNAAWLMYAMQNGMETFDSMIPLKYKDALSYKHEKITMLPAISFGTTVDEIKSLAEEGYFIMKIKVGSPGTPSEMLEKDMDRMKLIHQTIGHIETPYTQSGKINYTLDANGRYESRDALSKLLDHCEKIGAKDQILLIEEPFDENLNLDVSGFGLPIAADESVHTDKDAKKLIELGYQAFALKPTPKTLSMTFKIADVAYKNNIGCYCADLTVNPVLVEWNKNIAARLPPLPGLKTGVLETNGHQNYLNWETMKKYRPIENASWDKVTNGFFELNDDFYTESGGIFLPSSHYQQLFEY